MIALRGWNGAWVTPPRALRGGHPGEREARRQRCCESCETHGPPQGMSRQRQPACPDGPSDQCPTAAPFTVVKRESSPTRSAAPQCELTRKEVYDFPHALAPSRQLLSKVPEVTVYFWIIKVLCTTVGESAADFLNVNLNFGLTRTSVVTGVLLVVALISQFRADRYMPSRYWLTVALVSVFGTLVTDNLTDTVGLPLEASTLIFKRSRRPYVLRMVPPGRRWSPPWTRPAPPGWSPCLPSQSRP